MVRPVQHALKTYIVSVIKQFTDSWCVLVTISVSLTPSEEGLEPLSICRGTKTVVYALSILSVYLRFYAQVKKLHYY